jgi:hypothetical protein
MSLKKLRHPIPAALALAACALAHAADAPYANLEPEVRKICKAAPDYPPRAIR